MTIDEIAGQVSAHYAPAHLADNFDRVLRSWGKDTGPLTPSDLAPIDQFHFGGARATIELADHADIGPGTHVLDVGGGFGGPARTLASTYGSPVTVLELTKAYCDIGQMLTARCGLEDLVSFRNGDALAIPYPNAEFDRVWTQQSSMNIANKQQLYQEIHRVLRPGGLLVLYEVMAAGTSAPILFPVPWAEDASISFLSDPGTIYEMLTEIGFRSMVWEDLTDRVAAAGQSNLIPADAPGLHLVLGDDFRERARNGIRNLAEHRASLTRAVLQRP